MNNAEKILKEFREAINSIPKDVLMKTFKEVNSLGDGDGISVEDYFTLLQNQISYDLGNKNLESSKELSKYNSLISSIAMSQLEITSNEVCNLEANDFEQAFSPKDCSKFPNFNMAA